MLFRVRQAWTTSGEPRISYTKWWGSFANLFTLQDLLGTIHFFRTLLFIPMSSKLRLYLSYSYAYFPWLYQLPDPSYKRTEREKGIRHLFLLETMVPWSGKASWSSHDPHPCPLPGVFSIASSWEGGTQGKSIVNSLLVWWYFKFRSSSPNHLLLRLTSQNPQIAVPCVLCMFHSCHQWKEAGYSVASSIHHQKLLEIFHGFFPT